MKKCHGTVTNPDNKNFGNRCSLLTSNDDVFCKYHKKQINNKDVCMTRIEEYLLKTSEAKGKNNKISVVDDLYNFMVHNIEFVNEIDNFKKQAIGKLEQFINEGWTGAEKYLNVLKQA